MLEPLLDAGTCLDWISPVAAEIQDLVNGPHHTFLIDEACGRSANDIRDLLQGHGIKTWGIMFHANMILLTVKQAQALWAEYLLRREGVPILSSPVAGAHSPFGRSHQRAQHGAMGWLDALFDLIGL